MNNSVHLAFYETSTEKHLQSVTQPFVPRKGERVWISSDGMFSCWEVDVIVWDYADPGSMAALRGEALSRVDIMVVPSEGVFA